ncbi:hypothetical protein CASFOL_022696 [Castilleja foliolosa]|uniref:Uncharacterized protein n=1 Tax=Castilleja foliolosa TaxID=1961234 RepID=A0ABD3CXW7_9LAMI
MAQKSRAVCELARNYSFGRTAAVCFSAPPSYLVKGTFALGQGLPEISHHKLPNPTCRS